LALPRSSWVAIVVAALVVASCGTSNKPAGATKGTKNIGLSTSISGSAQLFGEAGIKGIQLAVDEINAKAGVNGYTINLITRDDVGAPNKAVENVRGMILEDKAVAIFGSVTSSACLAVSPVTKQYNVPFFTFTCNTVNLTTKNFQSNIVSVVPNTHMEGGAIGVDIGKKTQYKTFYMLAPDYEYGHVEADAFKKALQKTNPSARIIGEDYSTYPTANFTPYITKILGAKPDVAYSNIFAGDLVNFVTQATPFDFFNKTIFTTQSSVDDLQTLGAKFPVNIRGYARAPFFAIDTQANRDFVKRYRAKYNKYPSDWAIMGYDAFTIWAAGANKAGSFDTKKVLDNVVGQSFNTLRGKITIRKIDHQGDVPEWLGTLTMTPDYPFPIFKDTVRVPGDQLWLSEDEVKKLQP
jgi:branched-chain amino acid transport system substrate-binding protein